MCGWIDINMAAITARWKLFEVRNRRRRAEFVCRGHKVQKRMPDSETPLRFELAEEQVEIGKREVERGRIIVRTRVDIRDECAEVELRQDEVSVERVPIGRVVDVPPQTREEHGVLIVPVLEEQVVVTTRLVLKEEIRITKRGRVEVVREPVQLRSEQADVIRLDGQDPGPTTPTEGSNGNG
jgi:uncharacterized protein (TIGR02271 family)